MEKITSSKLGASFYSLKRQMLMYIGETVINNLSTFNMTNGLVRESMKLPDCRVLLNEWGTDKLVTPESLVIENRDIDTIRIRYTDGTNEKGDDIRLKSMDDLLSIISYLESYENKKS